ncbi:MAG: diacylglycerol kinase family protein [Bacteroidia bacterium]
MKRRIAAFKYAFQGIVLGFKSEFHLKVHVFLASLAAAAGWFFEISKTEWMLVLLCMALVISAELFNAAIECLANRITVEKDPLIGAAKDLAAGAVLITAIISLVIGLIIFIPHIWLLIS